MGQFVILLSGALAIWLSQSGIHSAAQWAPIIGLIGQPFWLHSTFKAKQWGMFSLSVFYTGAWLFGVWTHWIKS